MAIVKPSPPAAVVEAARSSLIHLSRPAFGKTPAIPDSVTESARLEEALQVFCLGLRSMVGYVTLAAAEAVAWRFFVISGTRAIASTEIAIDKAGGPPYWSHMSYDPRTQTRLSVIRRVERDPRYETGSYELRFLRVPALDLSALLWLKSEGTGQDAVIPMGAQAFVRPGWPYVPEKLFAALEGHARSRLAASTVPPGRGRA
jgi:hypothetical protein